MLAFAGSGLSAAQTQAPPLSAPIWLVETWLPDGVAQITASQSGDTAAAPASITKLLTAYTVLHAVRAGDLRLDDTLTVSARATQQDGTRVGYRVGETVRVSDALQGLLAISGNDAAWALAERVSAGTQAVSTGVVAKDIAGADISPFLSAMRVLSASLGLKQSQWHNPHGLTEPEPAPSNQSSAADLLRIARALWFEFPAARPWLGVKSYTWNGQTQANRNGLLYRSPMFGSPIYSSPMYGSPLTAGIQVDGLKTGHTEAAGYNLAASSVQTWQLGADTFDWRVSTVVLGAASSAQRTADSAALMLWARENATPYRLYRKGDALGSVKVAGATQPVAVFAREAIWAVLPKGVTPQSSLLNLRYELVALASTAPLPAGQVLGQVRVLSGGQLLATGVAVNTAPIERAGLLTRWWLGLKSAFKL